MTTIASIRPDHGVTCSKCGDVLTIPEWSEYVNEQQIANLWFCTRCGCQFETTAYVPADAVVENR